MGSFVFWDSIPGFEDGYLLNELSRGLEVLKTGDIVLLYFTTTQVYYSRNRFSVNDIAITISLNRDRVGVIAF